MSAAPRPVVPAVNQWSAEYLEQQYGLFLRDPEALPPDMRAFFQGFQLALAGDLRLFGQAGGTSAASAVSASAGLAGGGPAADAAPIRIMPTVGRPAGPGTPGEI